MWTTYCNTFERRAVPGSIVTTNNNLIKFYRLVFIFFSSWSVFESKLCLYVLQCGKVVWKILDALKMCLSVSLPFKRCDECRIQLPAVRNGLLPPQDSTPTRITCSKVGTAAAGKNHNHHGAKTSATGRITFHGAETVAVAQTRRPLVHNWRYWMTLAGRGPLPGLS